MQLSHATRVEASVLILVLATLATVIMTVSRAHVTEGITESRTEAYGRRFAPLRYMLPQNRVVGYISPGDTMWWGLHRTQYFLAPTLIDNSTEHDLIIGNFDRVSVDAEWLAARRLVLVRDIGNGVMLLTRSAK